MNAVTTKLLRQLYRALHVAVDDARKGGVTLSSDVERAMEAFEAWNMTVPDDDYC